MVSSFNDNAEDEPMPRAARPEDITLGETVFSPDAPIMRALAAAMAAALAADPNAFKDGHPTQMNGFMSALPWPYFGAMSADKGVRHATHLDRPAVQAGNAEHVLTDQALRTVPLLNKEDVQLWGPMAKPDDPEWVSRHQKASRNVLALRQANLRPSTETLWAPDLRMEIFTSWLLFMSAAITERCRTGLPRITSAQAWTSLGIAVGGTEPFDFSKRALSNGNPRTVRLAHDITSLVIYVMHYAHTHAHLQATRAPRYENLLDKETSSLYEAACTYTQRLEDWQDEVKETQPTHPLVAMTAMSVFKEHLLADPSAQTLKQAIVLYSLLVQHFDKHCAHNARLAAHDRGYGPKSAAALRATLRGGERFVSQPLYVIAKGLRGEQFGQAPDDSRYNALTTVQQLMDLEVSWNQLRTPRAVRAHQLARPVRQMDAYPPPLAGAGGGGTGFTRPEKQAYAYPPPFAGARGGFATDFPHPANTRSPRDQPKGRFSDGQDAHRHTGAAAFHSQAAPPYAIRDPYAARDKPPYADPSKRECYNGGACTRPGCTYAHPPGNQAPATQPYDSARGSAGGTLGRGGASLTAPPPEPRWAPSGGAAGGAHTAYLISVRQTPKATPASNIPAELTETHASAQVHPPQRALPRPLGAVLAAAQQHSSTIDASSMLSLKEGGKEPARSTGASAFDTSASCAPQTDAHCAPPAAAAVTVTVAPPTPCPEHFEVHVFKDKEQLYFPVAALDDSGAVISGADAIMSAATWEKLKNKLQTHLTLESTDLQMSTAAGDNLKVHGLMNLRISFPIPDASGNLASDFGPPLVVRVAVAALHAKAPLLICRGAIVRLGLAPLRNGTATALPKERTPAVPAALNSPTAVHAIRALRPRLSDAYSDFKDDSDEPAAAEQEALPPPAPPTARDLTDRKNLVSDPRALPRAIVHAQGKHLDTRKVWAPPLDHTSWARCAEVDVLAGPAGIILVPPDPPRIMAHLDSTVELLANIKHTAVLQHYLEKAGKVVQRK